MCVTVDQINTEHMGSSRFDLPYEFPDIPTSADASQFGSFAMNQQDEMQSSPGLIDSVSRPEGPDRVVRFSMPGQADDDEDLETGARGEGDRVSRLPEKTSIASEVVATMQHKIRMRGMSGDLETEDCEIANGAAMQRGNSM